MKILSWNVNGIRAVMKKGFFDFLNKENPDILCLQEIKIGNKMREKEGFNEDMFSGYKTFWNGAERPGYSGTAVLIKIHFLQKTGQSEDLSVCSGLGVEDYDIEGRTQIIEFNSFYLVNGYFPNANHELSRLDFKIGYNDLLLNTVKKLEKKKPVIITGDYNVAHKEIDLARPKENIGNPGFTFEERGWMTKFLNNGFIDTFRYLYPNKVEYSWWSYRAGARPKNIGWRIDYFCVSDKMLKLVKDSFILTNVKGSDHCPVGIEL